LHGIHSLDTNIVQRGMVRSNEIMDSRPLSGRFMHTGLITVVLHGRLRPPQPSQKVLNTGFGLASGADLSLG